MSSERPKKKFVALPKTRLTPVELIEELRNRSITAEDTVYVHWLCDSYMTLLHNIEDLKEAR